MSDQGNSRSISIGGNVTGASIVSGDNNRVTTTVTQVQPPPAREVDVAAEISGLRDVMSRMAVAEPDRLKWALVDANEEAAKPEPDKGKVAGALERAVTMSQGAADFAENADKIKERLVRIAGWLGPLAKGALALLGLSL